MRPYDREAAETELSAALDARDLDGALRAAAALDRMPPKPQPTIVGAALWYASHGLPVFPLQPGTKVPLPGSRGVKDATCDRAEVRAMFNRPGLNLGLATGHRVDVIDFDGPEAHREWGRRYGTAAEQEGVLRCVSCSRSWDATALGSTCVCGASGESPLPVEDPEWTVLASVSTPREGGLHVYVPTPPDRPGNRAGLVPGVDYRGLGGYVVAPPSETPAGSYRFLRTLDPRELP